MRLLDKIVKPNVVMLLLGIIALGITSCWVDGDDSRLIISTKDLNAQPIVILEKYNTIGFDSLVFLPGNFSVVENNLIIFDREANGFFKVFGLDSFKHKFTYPNLETPADKNRFIDFNSIRSANGMYSYLEYPYLKCTKIDQEQKALSEVSSTDLSGVNQDINRIIQLNDTLFMGMNELNDNFESQQHYLFSSAQNQIIKTFGKFPEEEISFATPMDKYRYYVYGVDALSDRIIVAHRNLNKIKIYNYDGVLVREIVVGDYRTPQSQAEERIYFIEPRAVADGFYVVYYNVNSRDAIENLDDITFKPELHKYDWEGNLKHRYKLPLSIYTYTITPNEKQLLGATYSENIPIVNIPLR